MEKTAEDYLKSAAEHAEGAGIELRALERQQLINFYLANTLVILGFILAETALFAISWKLGCLGLGIGMVVRGYEVSRKYRK